MNLRDLADRFISGDISIPVWQSEMKEFIRTIHREATIAACGGIENVTQAEWGYEGYLVKLQYQYLDQFAADIRANPAAWRNGRLYIRMELYRKAEWGTFEQMIRFQRRQDGWTEEMRDLGAADHCNGCLEQASKKWQKIGTLEPIGSQDCATNCHCTFWFRKPDGQGGWLYEKGN